MVGGTKRRKPKFTIDAWILGRLKNAFFKHAAPPLRLGKMIALNSFFLSGLGGTNRDKKIKMRKKKAPTI